MARAWQLSRSGVVAKEATLIRRVPIGEMLLRQGRIDAAQLQSALAHQRQWGGRLGRALVALGFVTDRVLLEAVGRQVGIPFVEIGSREVPPAVLRLVPEKMIRTRHILPLELVGEPKRNHLVVALSEADNLATLDEVAFASGMRVRAVLAAEADVSQAIARLLDGAAPAPSQGIELGPERGGERMDLVERPHTPRSR